MLDKAHELIEFTDYYDLFDKYDTLTKISFDYAVVEKENDVAMGATKANSAIVHAGFDAKEGSLKAIGTLEELRSLTGEEKLEEIFLKISE